MSKRNRVAFGVVLASAWAIVLMPACESVPLTAAPGTTMTVLANPEFVIANGGVSVVTAILVEPAGTFVPDGTEVFFFTNLGRVDASGKSHNGVVRVNFVSDARSGTAHVQAISGGPAVPGPSPSPSAAATLSGVTASAAGAGVTTPAAAVGDIAAASENSGFVDIKIGSALPTKVVVTANPPYLAGAREATITANVFDDNGNTIQNVPVIFTLAVQGTAPLQEVLASGGSPQYTDSNGQAFDTLTTRTANGTSVKTVRVTAALPVGSTDGSVDVTVNYAPVR
jgi:hypothetical protein